MARTKDFDENEMLQKAISLFWDKGYNGTSMQDLVDGLGLSRSSLYDTFGDKRQLYLRALEQYQADYGKQLCSLIQQAPNAKHAVKQLLELIVNDLLNDKQRKGCFVVNAGIELGAHDEYVNKLICQSTQQLEQAFLKVIKQGQQKDEFDSKADPQALAHFLSNTVKGIQVSVKSTTNRAFYDDIVQTAMRIFS